MKLHAIIQNGSRLKDFADIYFLLEKMPLIEMYAAYEQKYFPDSSGAVARMALNDTSRVNENDAIILADRPFVWPEIKARLTEAIEFYNRVFPTPSQRQTIKNIQSQKQNKGFRP